MEPVVVFDGVCNLCNFWVRWVQRHDPKGHFWFASFDSAWALSKNLKPSGPPGTMLVVDGDAIYLRAAGVAYILKRSNRRIYRWAGLLLGRVPSSLANLMYDGVARIRYNVFGRKQICAWYPGLSPRRFLP